MSSCVHFHRIDFKKAAPVCRLCSEYLGADGVTCVLCGKINSNPANARRHVRFVHLGYSEAVSCELCGKPFARKQFLHRHMRTQHGADALAMC